MESVMIIHHEIPAVAHLGGRHIFALPQIRQHVKSHILHIFAVVCPARIKLVVAHLPPVQIKDKLPQAADKGLRLFDLLF